LDTMQARPGLYIGSTSYEIDEIDRAMNYFARPISSGHFTTPALAHGETSDSHWVAEQLKQLKNVSALKCVRPGKFDETEKYYHLPRYVVRPGQAIDPDQLDLLFYRRAQQVFPVFQSTCDVHHLKDQRLQIGINTIDLMLFGLWWQGPGQLDVFIERTRRETHQIWELTGGKVFFLIETPTATILANMLRGKRKLLDWYTQAFTKLVKSLPPGAGWGFHFCYGRLGGDALGDQGILKPLQLRRLIYKPRYTVQMSNHVLSGLAKQGLIPELVQYPFALGSRPPSLKPRSYEPFRKLVLPDDVRAYAGAISPRLNLTQQANLFHLLDDVFRQRVGMSASCGYGSDDLDTMAASIRMMEQIAAV
jgi:hypothetical protein